MPEPIIKDQYTAARVYFASVIGLFLVESLIRLPGYLYLWYSQGHPRSSTHASHWKITVLFHQLVSRPSPLPSVIDYHVPHIIRFIVFAALNVIFALNDNEYTTDYKLYGWLCLANGGLALLMASRTNLFAIVLRIPSTVILQYHRWIGLAAFAHATTHISYNIQHYIATQQLASSFVADRIRIGMMAWVALTLMFLTSLPIVRRRYFEIFYYTHALFIIFVIGALIHTTNGPEFLLPGLGLWAIDRAIRFAYNFRTVTVESVSHLEGDVTKLRLSGRFPGSGKAAQIAWVQIPSLSFLNWHPFTVSTLPTESSDANMSIAIRGLGGFSRQVQYVDGEIKGKIMAADGAGPNPAPMPLKMRLDGPYGVGRINWGVLQLTVLIAGGIGITPAISIISFLIRQNSALGGAPTRHVHLLWIVKEKKHTKWFEEELDQLAGLVSQDGSGISLDIDIHVTSAKNEEDGQSTPTKEPMTKLESGKSWTIRPGRPNIKTWLDQVKIAHPGQDGAVHACGPPGLAREARQAACDVSSSDGIFFFEEEVFKF